MAFVDVETAERRKGGGSAFAAGLVVNSPANGQLVATNELTDLQERFCQGYLDNGGNGPDAAKRAGHAGDCHDVAHRNLKLPKIRARIQELVQIKLETKGAVVGYAVLMEIAQDPGAPPGVRRHCARDLLELAGFYKDKPSDSNNPRKSLAEMSREELEAVVAQGAAVLTAASRIGGPVIQGNAQDNAQDNAQVSDAPALSHSTDSE